MVIGQIIFALLFIGAIWLFSKNVGKIIRNIKLGKKVTYEGSSEERWKTMGLIALGQKKMFKKPLAAIMHFFIYAGFIIINIEMLEIIIDGLAGTHRIFSS